MSGGLRVLIISLQGCQGVRHSGRVQAFVVVNILYVLHRPTVDMR
jgi:hypothetical protein